jgi:hypothetical protein
MSADMDPSACLARLGSKHTVFDWAMQGKPSMCRINEPCMSNNATKNELKKIEEALECEVPLVRLP